MAPISGPRTRFCSKDSNSVRLTNESGCSLLVRRHSTADLSTVSPTRRPAEARPLLGQRDRSLVVRLRLGTTAIGPFVASVKLCK
jgi:hypothetical protein